MTEEERSASKIIFCSKNSFPGLIDFIDFFVRNISCSPLILFLLLPICNMPHPVSRFFPASLTSFPVYCFVVALIFYIFEQNNRLKIVENGLKWFIYLFSTNVGFWYSWQPDWHNLVKDNTTKTLKLDITLTDFFFTDWVDIESTEFQNFN